MAKIQSIGIGKYITNPDGRKLSGSNGHSIEVLQISENHGNSFLCFPVVDAKANPVTVDKTRYQFIPIDTNVQVVTI